LLLREPPASGARPSVPLVAEGLLPQVAKLRENHPAAGERRSDLAQGELVPPLRLAGLHERLRLAGPPASLLKRSEPPRSLAEQSLGGVPPVVAHAEQQANDLAPSSSLTEQRAAVLDSRSPRRLEPISPQSEERD
jgi:hypothetical protein